MATTSDLTIILDERTDADSPITEDLYQDDVSNAMHAVALVRSDGTAIMAGAVDVSPTNVSSSWILDANPTAGAVGNVIVGHYFRVLSGSAKGALAKIIDTSGNYLQVNSNLYSQGMRSADTYHVFYGQAPDKAHTHDGIDSFSLQTSATFEWEAKRVTSGAGSGAYTTNTFDTAFAKQPVVVAIGEGASTASAIAVAASGTPKTSFLARTTSGGNSTIHYFACTPGSHIVNGNLIVAGSHYLGGNGLREFLAFRRAFSKAAVVLISPTADWNGTGAGDPPANDTNQFVPLAGSSAFDVDALDGGGAHSVHFWKGAASANYINYIIIEPTAVAQDATSPTWGGSGTLKTGTKFEAGVFRSSANTGTITFFSAFSANPIVILQLGRRGAEAAEAAVEITNASLSTTAVGYTISAGMTNPLVAFLAIVTGHGTASAVKVG